MTAPLSRAEAILLTGWLASQEADEITYAWPRASEAQQEHAQELYALQRQCGVDAEALCGGDLGDTWQSAMAWLRGGAE